ncbi:acetylserotonin O-methyltransferase-like [Rhinopithecus roxellana]|uniref:acetylserotonin O-methyltransferase-like n=1 Tax=Rhinopithecus roxellana TaxID=61622 RepID=UPI0012372761|nr:acetylserotonin O-methyltransferase-like [Rhinopithecus roxellana]
MSAKRLLEECDVGGEFSIWEECSKDVTFTKLNTATGLLIYKGRSTQMDRQNDQKHVIKNGDFFKDPLPEADLYILARILHDWADGKCLHLLERVYHTCKPGGGILVIESLLDEDRRGPLLTQLYSLNMLVQTEGQERTPTHYHMLLSSAGFRDFQFKKTGAIYDAV